MLFQSHDIQFSTNDNTLWFEFPFPKCKLHICLVLDWLQVHVWLSFHTSLYESCIDLFVGRILYTQRLSVYCESSSYCLDKVCYRFIDIYIHTTSSNVIFLYTQKTHSES
jgi:hypothetical protein